MKISITVNGKQRTANAAPETLLSEFLRVHLGLTGTHVGCDTSQCGACAVHLDGDSVKSCTLLAAQADGRWKSKPSKEWRTLRGAASAPRSVPRLPRIAVRMSARREW